MFWYDEYGYTRHNATFKIQCQDMVKHAIKNVLLSNIFICIRDVILI